ncbi:MAG: helix-turn-helix domain-containing protein [Prolixibacteraceae bacterium]
MYQRKIKEDTECGITLAMKTFGGKWKPCIIDAISRGITRPADMQRMISEATPRVIQIQLSELMTAGIVTREIYDGFPLHTEYSLTETGKSILPVLAMMNSWGLNNRDQVLQALSMDGSQPLDKFRPAEDRSSQEVCRTT